MVRRHRRDAAPVVDAGANELGQTVWLQVGRRLDVHGRAQDQAGNRDGPGVVLKRRLCRRGHARAGLGAEVLDDHFLNVAVARVDIADSEQRLDALGPRLADADQDAGGERHARAAGGLQRGEAHGRRLVGRAEVRAAALRQPLRRRLQHDALGDGDLAQAREPGFVHHAGVEMRQQPGLAQHERCAVFQIGQCRVEAERGKRLAGGGVAQLGLVAQREQRLLAAGGLAGAGDLEHRIRREVVRLALIRRAGEGAVVAHVAAEPRQRDEHLLGEADVCGHVPARHSFSANAIRRGRSSQCESAIACSRESARPEAAAAKRAGSVGCRAHGRSTPADEQRCLRQEGVAREPARAEHELGQVFG